MGSFSFTSCKEINTTNPAEAYKYWTGSKPTEDITLMNAQYWQSPHWTKEYILYLQFQPSKEWWNTFVEENRLIIDSNFNNWIKPNDMPTWFQPTQKSVIYRENHPYFDKGSRYFQDTLTNICFIYEIQL